MDTGYHVLDLSGAINIPLNKDTYAYCWQHVFVGVLLDYPEPAGQENDEANEDNNDAWFEIIFDCKGKAPEIFTFSAVIFSGCFKRHFTLSFH